MQYVIFGATGYIGSYIYHRLKRDGYNVIGTSRKAVDDELIFYDIQINNIDDILARLNDSEKKTAIICISESNIDRCHENYSQAYEINVVQSKKLICELLGADVQVIYFSSENVFNGVDGNYTEESQTNPINKYGMMKAEMEQYLLENKEETCIFRLSKVIGDLRNQQNFCTQLETQIEKGNVRCIKGNFMTFVWIEDIYQCCLLAARKKMKGLYNIAGDKAYSRIEFAEMFCNKMKNKNVEIKNEDVTEFRFKDNRPLNTSLNNSKFKKETWYQFMGMDIVAERYSENISKTYRPSGKDYLHVNDRKILKIDCAYIKELKKLAKMNVFGKCMMCLHNDIRDYVHEMMDVYPQGAYVRPHFHPIKIETKTIIEGKLLVVIFDVNGEVLDKIIMEKSGIFTTRLEKGIIHADIPLTNVVFHEIKTGPFEGKNDSVFPKWAPLENDLEGIAKLMNKIDFKGEL